MDDSQLIEIVRKELNKRENEGKKRANLGSIVLPALGVAFIIGGIAGSSYFARQGYGPASWVAFALGFYPGMSILYHN